MTKLPPISTTPKEKKKKSHKMTPYESAVRSIKVAQYKQQIIDPFVIVTSKGTIKYTKNAKAKGVLTSGGLPVTRSSFLQKWADTNDNYYSYTGRSANPKQIATIIRKGISKYALTKKLASSPKFVGSPIWKHTSLDYEAVGKSIFGAGWKAKNNVKLIRQAVLNNLDSTAFGDLLRNQANYETSSEFKSNFSTQNNIYQSIYGAPDDFANQATKNAVKNGWSTDQYASYLRSLPQYKTSGEYKVKLNNFADMLSGITGVGSAQITGPGSVVNG